jgi:hypothetical protein
MGSGWRFAVRAFLMTFFDLDAPFSNEEIRTSLTEGLKFKAIEVMEDVGHMVCLVNPLVFRRNLLSRFLKKSQMLWQMLYVESLRIVLQSNQSCETLEVFVVRISLLRMMSLRGHVADGRSLPLAKCALTLCSAKCFLRDFCCDKSQNHSQIEILELPDVFCNVCLSLTKKRPPTSRVTRVVLGENRFLSRSTTLSTMSLFVFRVNLE